MGGDLLHSMDVIGLAPSSWAVYWRSEGRRVAGNLEPIHRSVKSAFRPCGRDLGEFFQCTGWALYGQSDEKHS